MQAINLLDHLRRHAGRYFTDLCGPVHVELRRTCRRTNSILQEYVVGCSSAEHTILVKQPATTSGAAVSASAGPDRPRLFPKALPESKSRFEFSAMAAIERHISQMNDPRFAAVRVFELLPDQQAMVMEKVKERNLSHLLLSDCYLPLRRAARARIDRIVRNCGSWLSCYHGLPELEHTQSRGSNRSTFVDAIVRFTEYLGRANERTYFEKLGRDIADAAEANLPQVLPLGLAHGDYAPRNVLAAPCGQIRVIDTQARWKAPIFEDISHFLVAIKASTPQVLSRGLACRPRRMANLERQFLYGYFGREDIPFCYIRLFECQTLIERWAAITYRARDSRGWKQIAKGGRASWANKFLRNLTGKLLYDLHTAATPSNAHEAVR